MSVDGKQISDFNAGILMASRLTEMGRQVNQLTVMMNQLSRLAGPGGYGFPTVVFTLLGAATAYGVYTGRLYSGSIATFDPDSVGAPTIAGDGDVVYAWNTWEVSANGHDLTGDFDLNTVGFASGSAALYTGVMLPIFSRSDQKRLVLFQALSGDECAPA